MDLTSCSSAAGPLGVVPILVGPLQALLTLLPIILVALGSVMVSLAKGIINPKKMLAMLWSQRIALAILAVVVGGFWTASRLGWINKPDAAVETIARDGEWSAFRGGPQRTGALLTVNYPGDPGQGGVQWQKNKQNGLYNMVVASPAVVGNRVYITTAEPSAFTGLDGSGSITCLDAEKGELVWTFDRGYRPTFSSPAVKGKYLVVGEGLHFCKNGRVFCLDVEASEKERAGVKLWEYRTASHVESSPAIGEGIAVVGAGDDGLFCFALEGDGKGGPKLLWHKDGKEYPDCESSPIIHDGKVYFCLGNDGQGIVCVDAKDGKELWRIDTPYTVFGAPAIADGKLVVGMGVGDMVFTAEALAEKLAKKLKDEGKNQDEIAKAVAKLVPGGSVWCIELSTHKVLWQHNVPKTVLGAVAIAGDKAYFGCQDGKLYCVSMDNKSSEFWDAHAPIITSPAIGKDTIYAITNGGLLYGLDISMLKPVWEWNLNSMVMSSPAVAGGHIYVGTYANGLLCVGKPGRVQPKPVWAGYLGGPGKSGWTEGSMLADKGTFTWCFPERKEDAPLGQVSVPPAVIGDAMYVASASGTPGLTKLALSDKTPAQKPAWQCPSKYPVTLSPAATEECAYFVDGKAGDDGRLLRCVNAATGSVLWSMPVAKDASGLFDIVGDFIAIVDQPGRISAIDLKATDAANRLAWSQPIGAVTTPPVAIGKVLYAIADDKLLAMDMPTGQMLFTADLPATPVRSGLVAANDQLWAACGDQVYSFDPLDGKVQFTIATGRASTGLVVSRNRMALVNEGGQIVLIDITQGAEEMRIPDAQVGFEPAMDGDNLLYFNGQSLQRYHIQSQRQSTSQPATASAPASRPSTPVKAVAGGPKTWMAMPAWMGKPVTSVMVVKSQVFLATDKLGLICAGSSSRK